MAYQTILADLVDGCTGLITLNRPLRANALSQLMAEELVSAIQLAEQTPSIRSVIITGAGMKAFCSGADLKERHGMTKSEWHVQHEAFEQAVHTILHCHKPVIAAVNGAAMGGGLELALACDFIYASEKAMFGLTEARLGIMPGMGGTQLLSRAIGARRAKEMMYLAEPVTSHQAWRMGFINSIFKADALLPACMSVALKISGNAPLSIAAIKHAVDEGAAQPLDVALRTELRYYNGLLETQDRHEGINAFNEKRKPRFMGN